MRRTFFTLALLAACLAFAQHDAGTPLPPGFVRLPPGKEDWKPGTPPFPASLQVTILEGDPTGPGHFTARVKFPAGFVLPLHTHPVDERSTVISGAVYVGTSDKPDPTKGIKLEAGGFYVNPKGQPHWFMTATETVLQISTEGPWGSSPVKPK
ncbi:MAG: cupin domain-containing protein [Myxococcota bacterium]